MQLGIKKVLGKEPDTQEHKSLNQFRMEKGFADQKIISLLTGDNIQENLRSFISGLSQEARGLTWTSIQGLLDQGGLTQVTKLGSGRHNSSRMSCTHLLHVIL